MLTLARKKCRTETIFTESSPTLGHTNIVTLQSDAVWGGFNRQTVLQITRTKVPSLGLALI